MLHNKTKSLLQKSRNLLAFSAGGDSTALFFLLLKHNITFDIAIVDYGIREQSKQEVAYAQKLAKEYNLRCHLYKAENITHNFEAQAREIRYSFFEELINTYHYENLLTAHHLGDRLEWFLMQLCKGAGCVELAGMQMIEKRKNYTLVRPLLHVDKEDLLAFLEQSNHHYFHDASNDNQRYTRNYFRHTFAQPLFKKYKKGIAKSFEYIDNDTQELIEPIDVLHYKEFAYFQVSSSSRSNLYAIDKYLKSLGHIITAQERKLLNSLEKGCVLGRKYIVTQTQNYIFIAPYLQTQTPLPKTFKEKMRKLKIDPKLRAYLFCNEDVVLLVSRLLA